MSSTVSVSSRRALLLAASALITSGVAPTLARAQNPLWVAQWSPPTPTYTGYTHITSDGAGGALSLGSSHAQSGGGALVVHRHDAAGVRLWQRAIPFGQTPWAQAVASDGVGGALVFGARLEAALGDAKVLFVARCDASGNLLWTKDWSDPGGWPADAYHAVSDGAGGAFVAGAVDVPGELRNAAVWRFDSAGNPLWRLELASTLSEAASSIASDGAGGAYFCGWTRGDLAAPHAGEHDAMVGRVDGAGALLWVRQLGTPATEAAADVTADGAGGVVITGHTYGALGGAPQGAADAWVARFDGSGNPSWTRQFGTGSHDSGVTVSADRLGGVLVTGATSGALGGPNAGPYDVWIARLDLDGSVTWIRSFGSAGDESVTSAFTDVSGDLFLCGRTTGDLWAPNPQHLGSGWIARFDHTATPRSYCTAGMTTHGCAAAMSATGSASASAATSLTLHATNVEGARSGLILYGINGRDTAPWGAGSSSLLCVKAPLQRTPTQASGGAAGQCDGAFALDWNAYVAANPGALGAPFAAGAVVNAQAWFRDPPASNATNLSDGLEFTLQP